MVAAGLTGIVAKVLSEDLYHFKVYVPKLPAQPVAVSDTPPPVGMYAGACGVGIGEARAFTTKLAEPAQPKVLLNETVYVPAFVAVILETLVFEGIQREGISLKGTVSSNCRVGPFIRIPLLLLVVASVVLLLLILSLNV